MQQLDGMQRRSLSRGLRQADAAQPVWAMAAALSPSPLDERLRGAGSDQDVCGASGIKHLAGVDHHLIKGCIAGNAADAKHLKLWVVYGVKDCQGVIDPGIDIHNNPFRHSHMLAEPMLMDAGRLVTGRR
jgi:hypothetical protein